MSSIDSDTDPDLPSFKTIVTVAVVEPDRSRASSGSFTKYGEGTNKNRTSFKSTQILRDLDLIEVIPDHINNKVNSVTGGFSRFSHESLKKPLSANQGYSTEELLHPLESTRVKPSVRKPPRKKKEDPKPLKRGAVATRNQYNIKKFNYFEISSDDDDICGSLMAMPKETKSRTRKRGGPITNKQTCKKAKKSSADEVYPCHKNGLPEVKSKRPLTVDEFLSLLNSTNPLKINARPKHNDGKIKTLSGKIGARLEGVLEVEKFTGYAENFKQHDDYFSSLSSLSSPLKLDADPKPKDALETRSDKSGEQLESVLENIQEISTKCEQKGYTRCFQQDDDYWSLSSLDSSIKLKLNSNLKPVDEPKTLNDKIYSTSKQDLEDGVRIQSDCNYKTNEEMHSVKDVDLNGSTVDEFTEANRTKLMVASQDDKLELLTEGKLKKSEREICKWIATCRHLLECKNSNSTLSKFLGMHKYQQDAIFKQAKWRLKELLKDIQISFDMIVGPITVKNYKFYKILLDLDDKLNTNFRESSDTDEQDFDDFK